MSKVLTVPDGYHWGMVDHDAFITVETKVRLRRWISIADRDTCTARDWVECQPWEDENSLNRSSVVETAGTVYQGWLG